MSEFRVTVHLDPVTYNIDQATSAGDAARRVRSWYRTDNPNGVGEDAIARMDVESAREDQEQP